MKVIIIFFSLIGLIPFYSNFFLELDPIDTINSTALTYLYCCMIVSFLSGMQWQRFVNANKTSIFLLSLPMINFLWCWSSLFNKTLYSSTIVTSSLFFSLLLELIFQRSLMESWFIKLRVVVTFFAILSFFI